MLCFTAKTNSWIYNINSDLRNSGASCIICGFWCRGKKGGGRFGPPHVRWGHNTGQPRSKTKSSLFYVWFIQYLSLTFSILWNTNPLKFHHVLRLSGHTCKWSLKCWQEILSCLVHSSVSCNHGRGKVFVVIRYRRFYWRGREKISECHWIVLKRSLRKWLPIR